ncbi:HTH-type transcriptional regulator immR [uncultured Flavonifractor sp.]|nr:HTH-type transcriptional regulator immR [uncultured Flavonifractor sp.]
MGRTKEIFSQRMRELRKQTGQPQKVLAELLDVSVNQISEMEKGTRMTTLEKLAVICQHYNVSADYLLGLTDERRPLREDR